MIKDLLNLKDTSKIFEKAEDPKAERIAQEVNSLMGDGMDWNDACNQIAKKHGRTKEQVTKIYKAIFGSHPSDFE